MNDTRKLYHRKYFEQSKRFQTNVQRIQRLVNLIQESSPKRVLDVGCGWGSVVKKLREAGVEAWGVDFAEPVKDFWQGDYYKIAEAKNLPFPDKSFDVVFSSDFFEHIPEEDIGLVLAEMKRVGGEVLAVVAVEAPLSLRQANYHLTNKPLGWWKSKLLGAKVVRSE